MTIIGLCFDAGAARTYQHHDLALVLVALLVALAASYTALDMIERLRASPHSLRWFWRLGAAVILGGGVWSMHFIAMLAGATPVPVQYDPGLTFMSGLICIGATAIGLTVLDERKSLRRILAGGTLVGLGVIVMHYMGMEAMRLPAEVIYHPGPFVASAAIAVASSTVALWLSVTVRTLLQRAAASLVMALAIAGLHFTAMSGTALIFAPGAAPGPGPAVTGTLISVIVLACVALTVTIGLMCAYLDRRLESQAHAESLRLRRLNGRLESAVASRTADLTSALDELDDQRRRAEQANRAKSDFLANMSHELRTPLNAVIGFADLLKLGDGLGPRQAEAVEQIHLAGRHLLALIEDVLDFARIESGKLTVSLAPIDVLALADGLVAGFGPMADQAGVTIRVAPGSTPLGVLADHLRLKQALSNLVSNAIKYNRPGGLVELRARVRGGRVLIDVRDTGVGIPAERMSDLFEPFERLGFESSSIEGAGLGLALTRRLVEAMGGKLHVHSQEGAGATFTIDLAAADAAPGRPCDPVTPAPTGALPEAVVLYIEDNASNIRLMRHIVEALGGIELHVAERPLDGLEMAGRLQPDVILLDINLPGMDGFQVKRHLDADPATRGVPVIAISANVLAETRTRGQIAGFHSYLAKPIDIHSLVSAIQDAMQTTMPAEALSA